MMLVRLIPQSEFRMFEIQDTLLHIKQTFRQRMNRVDIFLDTVRTFSENPDFSTGQLKKLRANLINNKARRAQMRLENANHPIYSSATTSANILKLKSQFTGSSNSFVQNLISQ